MKNIGKRGIFTAAIAVAMFVGIVGGQVLKANQTSAQTTTPAVSTPSPTGSSNNTTAPSGSSGTFKSNEDPAHEAKESAQWEAQENAGQMPWMHK